MLDNILRPHATRQLAGAVIAAALAVPAAIWGGTSARTPDHPTFAISGTGHAHGAVEGIARVIDGDTLEIAGTRIRLEGIDTPEGDQQCARAGGGKWRCGQVAATELQRLVGTSEIRCESKGSDAYSRMLAICFNGQMDVNAAMVQRGLAWAFVKYSRTYVAQEADARSRGIGIWQAPTTTAWDHRAGRWAAADNAAPASADCRIKGNITGNGRIYHMPWSPWYNKVRIEPEKGERWFCDEREALAAGWRPIRTN